MPSTTAPEVLPSADQLLQWRVPWISAGLGVASVGVMAVATATSDHDFWLFAVWVVLTLAAIATGVAVLVRVRRGPGRMGTRRLASFGVVMAVLCATLGLAVYSQTRIHDCPTSGICVPADPGKGQRPQQP
ncbi:MAG TPA: hypothetical protein VMT43_09520 [Acidimicrobiales bacterium]|nr:hypothetical protein [Acidimicrobiales bacterium]